MPQNTSLSAVIAGSVRRRSKVTVPAARYLASGIAGLALALTFVAIWPWENTLVVRRWLVFWIFAPPAWFVFEYHLWAHEDDDLVKNGGLGVPTAPSSRRPRTRIPFEDFKYGQELASKWWAAVVALLAILLAG